LASGSLTPSRRLCWAWAACSPVYPWSTKATAPASPVPSGPVAAKALTWRRSCSLVAVTGAATRGPSLSTARGTCEPQRRLAPS
jgi:hypothetical protein